MERRNDWKALGSELRAFSELWPRPGVLGFPDGCSRFPAPGVLGLLFPCRVFSATLTGCSRFPVPGVLGILHRAFAISVRDRGVSRYRWSCYSEAYISGSITGLTNCNNPSNSWPNLRTCPLPAPSSSCRNADCVNFKLGLV